MYQKILVPVDLSETQLTAVGITEAVALARLTEGHIRLLNVQAFLPTAYADYVPTNLGDTLREAAEEEIVALADGIAYPADHISSVIRFGVVYQEVLAEAGAWGADMIVLCSHRPGMATYLIGSNASIIVRHANCSVLVVRR